MPKPMFARQTQASPKFEIKNKSETDAEIVIYSPIGQSPWGDTLSAEDFVNILKGLDPKKNLAVRINSPGGDVFDGMTIYNRLKQHKGKVTTYIDGLAASIASLIALAGDEIIMGEGALYMVHLPWTWAMGNRKDMNEVVSRLEDVEESMISIYSRRTKLDRSEVRSMLEAETWMSADVAIEKGFATSKAEDSLPIAASAFKQQWINKTPTVAYNSAEEKNRQRVIELKNKMRQK